MLHSLPRASIRTLHANSNAKIAEHAQSFCRCVCFTTFVHALRERAVFGAAEFDNRTFEGESFFNRSSVSHLKHATVKSNSK